MTSIAYVAIGLRSPIVALAADATTFQFPLSPWPTGPSTTGYNFGSQWTIGNPCPNPGPFKLHTAIDKYSPAGTAVYAAANGSYYGTITDQLNPQWGWAALITHNVPNEGFVLSQYWHIVKPTIQPGTINRGDPLSTLYDMGSSSHVHFGIQHGGSLDTTNSWAGALPTTSNCGYAKFPWYFIDPTAYVSTHLTPPTPSNNLLVNSSFEHDTSGVAGGLVDPWSLEDSTSEGWSLQGAGAADGATYLEAFTRNATPGHQSILQTPTISISPGESYTFSVWVRMPTASVGQVSVDLWALGNQTEGGATTVTVAGSWTQVSYTLNAQQLNTSLRAQIIMQTVNQNFDFDGAQLVRNSLQNSSFEHPSPPCGGTDPWTLEDSSQEAWCVKSGGAEDGASYLEAYTRNATPGHQSIVQMLPLSISQGQSYTFSVWVRGPNQVFATVSVDLWAMGGQLEGGSTTRTFNTINGAWTQVAYTLNAQYSNSSLKAQIIMQTAYQNYDFDGAQIVTNSLQNSNFEHGGTDPWSREDPASETWYLQQNAGAKDGARYLEAKTSNATPGHQSIVQTLPIVVYPGGSYTFAVWVRTPDGGVGQVSLDLWALGYQMEGGGTTMTVAGGWTQVSYTLNAQYSNTSLKAQIIIQTPNQYFDFDGAQI